MLKFILALLALYITSAKVGLNTGYVAITTSAVNCFKEQNITRVVMELLNHYGSVNSNFEDSFNYLRAGQITSIDAIVQIQDSWDPDTLCYSFGRFLPPAFDGILWLNVENFPGAWTKPISQRISYLEDIANSCYSYGYNVGVYSKVTSWTVVFGNPFAGSDILRTLPMWYYNDKGGDNFNDFIIAGFGKWSSPAMKEYKGNPTQVCEEWFNGVEYYENSFTNISI